MFRDDQYDADHEDNNDENEKVTVKELTMTIRLNQKRIRS